MLNDLMPIIVNLKKNTECHIKPLGDLHIGSPQFNQARWDAFKKNLKPTDYIICVGDLMESGYRNSVGAAVYEQTMSPGAQKEWLFRELEPFKDRILCGTGGNHDSVRSRKEVDSDPLYDVFCRLKIEERYRSRMAFLFIRIGKEAACPGKYKPLWVCCVTHGAGGGTLIGSGVNRVQRFTDCLDGVDVFICGHTHRPVAFPTAKLYADRSNHIVKVKQFTAVVCSSMMDYGGYGCEKMLSPTAQVDQEIILYPREGKISVIQGY